MHFAGKNGLLRRVVRKSGSASTRKITDVFYEKDA